MNTIPVKLTSNPYDIYVGVDIFNKLPDLIDTLGLQKNVIIISNDIVRKFHGQNIDAVLKTADYQTQWYTVQDGEQAKSPQVAFDLVNKVAAYDLLKSVSILAVGGGVVGDLAGFVAAIYKRGVPFIQIPTTLLAQIDSAIGGKVGVDLDVGKNLMGAFYQPKCVFSDIKFLTTLEHRQMLNGMAEAIKYGIIYDANLFDWLEKNYDKVFKFDLDALSHLVTRCSEIKSDVVVRDEKETLAIRTILNFGHTAGHAIEAAGKFEQYQHGEAIGVGMRIAVFISQKLNLIESDVAKRIFDLLDAVGLPKFIQNQSINDIMHYMKHDKKFVNGQNRFVLVKNIGNVVVKDAVPESVISDAVEFYM